MCTSYDKAISYVETKNQKFVMLKLLILCKKYIDKISPTKSQQARRYGTFLKEGKIRTKKVILTGYAFNP